MLVNCKIKVIIRYEFLTEMFQVDKQQDNFSANVFPSEICKKNEKKNY